MWKMERATHCGSLFVTIFCLDDLPPSVLSLSGISLERKRNSMYFIENTLIFLYNIFHGRKIRSIQNHLQKA